MDWHIRRRGGSVIWVCRCYRGMCSICERRSGRWSVPSARPRMPGSQSPLRKNVPLRRQTINFARFFAADPRISTPLCQSRLLPLSRVNTFLTATPGEHSSQLSCLGSGFYWLSNIHLAGPQLCMKDRWRRGSAERNDLAKLRSIGR